MLLTRCTREAEPIKRNHQARTGTGTKQVGQTFYAGERLVAPDMSEKIAQHRHCRQCGKAFVGQDSFCSEECKTASKGNIQKKKRQLTLLYFVTFIVLILALYMAWLG
jgi:predicted nucleic acid-binding Zn ribbon protein